MHKRLLLSLLITLALMFSGCSNADSGPEKFPVSGTVSYKGKPLKSGRIGFIPKGNELGIGPPSGCEIVDGAFQGTATPGLKKVEIYGDLESDKTELSEDGVTQIPVVESLPGKYNEGSTLEVELKSGPNEGLKFDLE